MPSSATSARRVPRSSGDLFSNFTYFLNDPVKGDQFEQQDGRWFFGGEARREWDYGAKNNLTVGFQTRHDVIDDIGLYNTSNRLRNSTTRVDDVYQGSAGIHAMANHHVNDWEVAVDCLNILGRDDNDIEYFYASRLPGEPAAGVDDIHLHPAEPRTFRVSLTRRF